MARAPLHRRSRGPRPVAPAAETHHLLARFEAPVEHYHAQNFALLTQIMKRRGPYVPFLARLRLDAGDQAVEAADFSFQLLRAPSHDPLQNASRFVNAEIQ